MDKADYDAAVSATQALVWTETQLGEQWAVRLDIEGGTLYAELNRNHRTGFDCYHFDGTISVSTWVEFTGTRQFRPCSGVAGLPDLAAAQRVAAEHLAHWLHCYWSDGVTWL